MAASFHAYTEWGVAPSTVLPPQEMKAMIATLLHHFSPCMEGPMPEPDFTHLGGLVVPKKECAFHLVLRE